MLFCTVEEYRIIIKGGVIMLINDKSTVVLINNVDLGDVKISRIINKCHKEGKQMSYTYKTNGTCSSQIELELDGDVVHNVKFTGGCDGNLKAIPALVEGLTVAEVEQKIGGIRCGFKNTSCGDQLAKACRAALDASRK